MLHQEDSNFNKLPQKIVGLLLNCTINVSKQNLYTTLASIDQKRNYIGDTRAKGNKITCKVFKCYSENSRINKVDEGSKED